MAILNEEIAPEGGYFELLVIAIVTVVVLVVVLVVAMVAATAMVVVVCVGDGGRSGSVVGDGVGSS